MLFLALWGNENLVLIAQSSNAQTCQSLWSLHMQSMDVGEDQILDLSLCWICQRPLLICNQCKILMFWSKCVCSKYESIWRLKLKVRLSAKHTHLKYDCAYDLIGLPIYTLNYTVNVTKFRTPFSVCSQTKCWQSGLEFTKCLPE